MAHLPLAERRQIGNRRRALWRAARERAAFQPPVGPAHARSWHRRLLWVLLFGLALPAGWGLSELSWSVPECLLEWLLPRVP